MRVEAKLKEMGIELVPMPNRSTGNFIGARRTGNLVYTSGHGAGMPEGGFPPCRQARQRPHHRAGLRLRPPDHD